MTTSGLRQFSDMVVKGLDLAWMDILLEVPFNCPRFWRTR